MFYCFNSTLRAKGLFFLHRVSYHPSKGIYGTALPPIQTYSPYVNFVNRVRFVTTCRPSEHQTHHNILPKGAATDFMSQNCVCSCREVPAISHSVTICGDAVFWHICFPIKLQSFSTMRSWSPHAQSLSLATIYAPVIDGGFHDLLCLSPDVTVLPAEPNGADAERTNKQNFINNPSQQSGHVFFDLNLRPYVCCWEVGKSQVLNLPRLS